MIWLQNAAVLDGTGAPAQRADVLLRGDKIAQIGTVRPEADAVVIDCAGMLCTPGFVDVHTHSDISLLACGSAAGHAAQGITSEVTGNCGYSPFPLRDDPAFIQKRRASLSLIDTPLVDWDWRTWPEYRRRLERAGTNVNLRALIGYGSVRAFVMGYDDRRPSAEELSAILSLLDEAFDSGVCGLSVGLGYAPDFYADTQELAEAAKIVRKHGAIFSYHIRGERLTLFTALREVIEIALQTGVRTEISHLKCAGKSNRGRMDEALRLIDDACAQGADITFDVYPYTAGASYLGLVFPPKYHEGGIARLLERLRDPAVRPDVLRDMERGVPGWSTFIGEYDGANLLISQTKTGRDVGKTVAELARAWSVTPYEAAARLMTENGGAVEMVMFMCSPEDVEMAVRHPRCLFGSDSMTMDPVKSPLRERPHPRYYGTFPTLLAQYGRTEKVPLETLVARMTGTAAARFGFEKRGLLRPGYYADLCVFRLEDIDPRASYNASNALAAGMRHVFVNGEPVIRDGVPTDSRPGRLL